MAVKKTQMYRRQLDGTETDLNPLTESQYVLMENGQTVQEVLSDRDSDKYTPVITNSSSTFKVGQGDNVDLSSSMKEGAYDSCVLKGKSMVNCIQEPSSQDVVLPYEFEDGQYVTINDTKESGALGVELKGQTLVNLVPSSVVVSGGRKLHKDDGSGQIVYTYKPKVPLKPNTVYTCFVWLKDVVNPNSVPLNCSMSNRDFYARPMTNGLNIAVGTTKSELGGENCNIRIANADVIAGARGVLLDAVVVEGDYSSIEINPFYGMASCKLPILHTVGNNLFDLSYYGNLDNLKNTTDAYVSYKKLLKLEPNTRYRILSDSCVLPARMWSVFGVDDKNSKRLVTVYNHSRWEVETENDYGAKDSVFTTPADGLVNFTCYARHRNPDTLLQSFSNEAMFTTTMGNLRLVKDGFSTVHEPYKSSILSLPEEVELRKVGDIEDTLNCNTGEYVQRIKEVVFNGSESWTYSGDHVSNEEYVVYHAKITDPINSSNMGIANKLTYDREAISTTAFTKECVYINSTYQVCYVRIKRERNGIIDYLTSNPLTVQYQLATPIVTKINLPSTLKSWNTTTHIYSEIPENTLYPILSHSNPSYPVILKPSTKYSIVANSYSNNHTNSTINFNLGGATASTVVGNRVTTITTPSTLSNELLTMSGRGNKLNNVMVIEGDVVGDEPYFEGICDCKSPILRNTGLTLYESPFEKVYGEDATREFFNMMDLAPYVDKWGANKNYTFSFDIKANKSGTARIYFQNGNGSRHNFVFGVPVTTEYVRHTVTTNISGTDHNWKESRFACFTTYDTGCFATIKNIQFAYGENIEPYKSNTTTFDQKDDKTIVLRSLPNGVCDTLNVETGEYVQRIGDYTVNGTETSWFTYIDTTGVNNNYLNQTSCAFGFHLTGKVKGNGILCDKLPTRSIGWWASGNTGEGICGIDNDNRIFLRVKNEKTGVLYTDNVSTALGKVKTYLTNNPVTVQYELATPIVTTIDVQGFPYAYTNGHVQLSSGSIEQSLTPTVEYSLSANKTGQIDNNTRQVVRQQNKLDDFEAMILTAMVQSAYDKAILQFDYEMQMMSLGGE